MSANDGPTLQNRLKLTIVLSNRGSKSVKFGLELQDHSFLCGETKQHIGTSSGAALLCQNWVQFDPPLTRPSSREVHPWKNLLNRQ